MTPTTEALRGVEPRPFWLDPRVPGNGPRPATAPPAHGEIRADLAVVGGGYTGLWTALVAKERDPSLRVVLLEAASVGWAASGRNGGFCAASVTHGLGNGALRYPDEIAQLERLGLENLDEIGKTVARYGIDCEFERTGQIRVATEQWQLAELEESVRTARALGYRREMLSRDEVRARIDSPTFVGGLWSPDDYALVHPAKLAWGLRSACEQLGVEIFEQTRVRQITDAGRALRLETADGAVTAERVVLGTGAFAEPLRRLRHYILPVYDYALVTEPLSDERLDAVGWRDRQGLADAGNQFHYSRLTSDNRILWGGYDAIYHFGNRIAGRLDQRPETFATLSDHFFRAFPQLAGVRFSHAWGGVIDTTSRFTVFFGTAFDGRLGYAAGYTGLGVGAARFGARVVLDLLSGAETELTRLEMVRKKPVPFPPEPLRYAGVQATRWSIASADRHDGRRNLWLRTLERFGVGFDS